VRAVVSPLCHLLASELFGLPCHEPYINRFMNPILTDFCERQ